MKRSVSNLVPAATGLLLSVFLWLTIKAFLQFDPHWDHIVYHLPAALRMFNRTTFTPYPELLALIDGYPPLGHFLTGLLICISGSIKMGNVLNAISFWVTLWVLRKIFGRQLNWRFFLLYFLTIPLLVLHMGSSKLDLFLSFALLISFAALMQLHRNNLSSRIFSIFLLGLLAAVSTKQTAWPVAFLFGLYASMQILRAGLRKKCPFHTAALRVFMIFLCLIIWPGRNLVKFHNPTYPMPFPVIAESVQNAPGKSFMDNLEMPDDTRSFPNSGRFVMSALELNRLRTDQPFVWKIDGHYDEGRKSSHYRMGGWSGVSFLIMSVAVAFLTVRRALPAPTAFCFFSEIVLISFLPYSHLLRYWNIVPLCGILLMSLSLRRIPLPARNLLVAASVIMAVWVVSRLQIQNFDFRPVSEHAPVEARTFWTTADRSVDYEKKGFFFGAIYWSGPDFNTFKVRGVH